MWELCVINEYEAFEYRKRLSWWRWCGILRFEGLLSCVDDGRRG